MATKPESEDDQSDQGNQIIHRVQTINAILMRDLPEDYAVIEKSIEELDYIAKTSTTIKQEELNYIAKVKQVISDYIAGKKEVKIAYEELSKILDQKNELDRNIDITIADVVRGHNVVDNSEPEVKPVQRPICIVSYEERKPSGIFKQIYTKLHTMLTDKIERMIGPQDRPISKLIDWLHENYED